VCRAGVLGTMCCFVFMQHNRLITRASCFRYVLCPLDLYEYECWYIVLVGVNVLAQYTGPTKVGMHLFFQVCKSYIRKFLGSIRIRKFLGCASPQIENPQFILFIRKFQNQKFLRCVKEDKEDKTRILKNVLASFRPFYDKTT